MLALVVVGATYIFGRGVRETMNEAEEADSQDPFSIWSYDGEIAFGSIVEAAEDFDEKYSSRKQDMELFTKLCCPQVRFML